MNRNLGVEADMVNGIRDFLKTESIRLEVGTDADAVVQVRRTADREESRLDLLFSGGWIPCPVARSLADRLDIETLQVGKLLDYLDIKVRDCELGCF